MPKNRGAAEPGRGDTGVTALPEKMDPKERQESSRYQRLAHHPKISAIGGTDLPEKMDQKEKAAGWKR